MSSLTPLITVIIPARPGSSEILAVNGARALEYPRERLEILVVRGRQPAAQRNIALQAAHGEFVYFLDDDAVPDPKNLSRAVKSFSDPEVVVVGGPNVCPDTAPFLERVFAAVLGSWLAFGPSSARYKPVGKARETSEKELILCNLIARHKAVVALGGFDETLYPNEENALMDSIQKARGKLIYDPEFTAQRRPRPNLRSFCKMLLTYGRGRAEQFRLHPSAGSALNLVPPLFCGYVALLLIALVLVRINLLPRESLWLGAPMLLYGLAIIAQTLALIPRHGLLVSVLAAPLQFASHILYGAGFWFGLRTNLKSPVKMARTDISLESIPL